MRNPKQNAAKESDHVSNSDYNEVDLDALTNQELEAEYNERMEKFARGELKSRRGGYLSTSPH